MIKQGTVQSFKNCLSDCNRTSFGITKSFNSKWIGRFSAGAIAVIALGVVFNQGVDLFYDQPNNGGHRR